MAVSDYTIVGEGAMCPRAVLGADLDYLDSLITFSSQTFNGVDALRAGVGIMIDDEILAISLVDDNIHVLRGCADTIPAQHTAGTIVWFYEEYIGTDSKDYGAGVTIGVKVLPFTTSGGSVPVANSPPNALPFDFRFSRPYPPARFQINGDAWYLGEPWPLDSTHGNIVLTWSTRNRVVQADQLIGHIDASISPEIGQGARLSFYNAADDTLLRQITTDTNYTYDRTTATIDFGLGNDPNPDDQVGYIILESIRDDLTSKFKYRIDFTLDPGALVEQPYGLGYRLGEFLGGYPPGVIDEQFMVNANFVYDINGKIVFSKHDGTEYRDAYVSEDGGKTFYLAADDVGDLGAYSGYRRWWASIGSQYVSVGINRFVALLPFGYYVGDADDITTPPTYVDGGPFDDSSEGIHSGFFGRIGDYYYIVGRLASQDQPSGKFYLWRSDDSLEFILQGEMTQLSTDPNKIPDGVRGSWDSHWFTPNGPTAGIYESHCILSRGYNNRWFLSNGTQLYYTDVASGLTGWKRCPIPYPGGNFSAPVFITATFKPSTPNISALYRQGTFTVNWSVDNGGTWTVQTSRNPPFDENDLPPRMVLFNGYFTAYIDRYQRVFNAYYKSFTAKTNTTNFPIFPADEVTGIEPEGQPSALLTGIEYVSSAPYVLGFDQLNRWVYSSDSIHFDYCTIVAFGTILLMNFTTDESDETGRHTPQLFNDATVGSGVVQFSGDGHLQIDQFHRDFAFGSSDFTVEVFAKIDVQIGVPVPNQWILVYGDSPNERSAAALSILAFGNGTDEDQIGLLIRVQTRNDAGAITVHSLGGGSIIGLTGVLYHIVIQRRADNLEFFFDGTLYGLDTIADPAHLFGRVTGSGKPISLGGGKEVDSDDTADDNPLVGSISAIRITGGEAVYPFAGFSVPSLPLT